jgi:hypothetical protein
MLAAQSARPTVTSKPRRRPRRLCDAFDWFEPTVAAAFAVSVEELHSSSRGAAPVALARQYAMYLAHVGFSLSYTEIGRRYGRDRTTAAHACRVIEERRDDPFTDRRLMLLESLCGALRRRLAQARGRGQ